MKKNSTKDIVTQIKNPDLVEQRRNQIVDASIKLFFKNGFHKTTTRQIAKASGFSIGSLYEYISSKEDILFLVCDSIHGEVEQSVNEILAVKKGTRESLAEMISEYFMICDKMSTHVLLMYQESKSLPIKYRSKIIDTEARIKDVFVKALTQTVKKKRLSKGDKKKLELIGHNIAVLGHMWSFRRWSLAKNYSIKEYIKLQTDFLLGEADLLFS